MIEWIILSGLITLLILYVQRKHTFWERQGVKGPKPLFLFGNTLSNLSQSIVALQEKYSKTYGKVFGTYDGLQPHLTIGDPELLREICVKDFNVFPSGFHFIYINPVERNFLINIKGAQWKRMRSMLSPTFSSGKMKKMFLLMKACTIDAKKALVQMSELDNANFNPKQFWGQYNMDVIAKCFFAANLNVYKDPDNSLLRNFVDVVKGDAMRILVIFTAPAWFTKAARVSRLSRKNLQFLHNLTLALIEKRKLGQDKVEDFLQILIDLESTEVDDDTSSDQLTKSKFTSEEIVSSSLIFLIAGYETTSSLLTWVSYRLALNPEIQEKLFDEVSKVNIEDYGVLNNLTYLEAVLNETLRINPPIVSFQRTAHKDYTLPRTNVLVPKNTRITIPIYAIHHDPDNYSDPEVFQPERFINDSPKPFTFVPFGAGPRTCIGMRFALINAKLALATLIRNFQIVPTAKTPRNLIYDRGTLLLVSENLKLNIKPRS